MAKIVTIKAPIEGGKTMEVQGVVAWFMVGTERHKFLIQHRAFGNCLTHYASGRVVSSIDHAKIMHMMRYGHNASMSDRAAAQATLDKIIAGQGIDKVLEQIRKYPTLND